MSERGAQLLAFSGLDGAGKSTQINLLVERWRAQGRRPVVLWLRGGYTPNFEKVKALWRRVAGRTIPAAGPNPARTHAFQNPLIRRLWLSIALLDLIWWMAVAIRWHLWRHRDVICDRFLLDTLIDFRLNFESENIESGWLWKLLVRVATQPHASFVLLVPVAESLRRSDIKGEPFRDSHEMLGRRLAEYQRLASEFGGQVLDGQRPLHELTEVIALAITPSPSESDQAHSHSPTSGVVI